MIRKALVSSVAAISLTVVGLFGLASPAGAQQEGLVNVFITDVAVQVPVSVAANVCDVNVAVLVQNVYDDAANCDADASSDATFVPGSSGGPAVQSGLVNLDLQNVAVQVPVSVAADICDVNVGVLVRDLFDDAATCQSDAVSLATA